MMRDQVAVFYLPANFCIVSHDLKLGLRDRLRGRCKHLTDEIQGGAFYGKAHGCLKADGYISMVKKTAEKR
jgi:hypothetical protein